MCVISEQRKKIKKRFHEKRRSLLCFLLFILVGTVTFLSFLWFLITFIVFARFSLLFPLAATISIFISSLIFILRWTSCSISRIFSRFVSVSIQYILSIWKNQNAMRVCENKFNIHYFYTIQQFTTIITYMYTKKSLLTFSYLSVCHHSHRRCHCHIFWGLCWKERFSSIFMIWKRKKLSTI